MTRTTTAGGLLRTRTVGRRLGAGHPRRALRRAAGPAVRRAGRVLRRASRRTPNGPSPISTGLDINDLGPEDARLMHLLYSMILVSYAVNIFKQNRIPDSGAAFFEMVAEPAL